jgi:hypothetical protein
MRLAREVYKRAAVYLGLGCPPGILVGHKLFQVAADYYAQPCIGPLSYIDLSICFICATIANGTIVKLVRGGVRASKAGLLFLVFELGLVSGFSITTICNLRHAPRAKLEPLLVACFFSLGMAGALWVALYRGRSRRLPAQSALLQEMIADMRFEQQAALRDGHHLRAAWVVVVHRLAITRALTLHRWTDGIAEFARRIVGLGS